MINLSNGITYEEYLNQANEEQLKQHNKAADTVVVSNETIDSVKNIKDVVSLVVFSEPFCPDCMIALPFLKKFTEINDKVKLRIFPRKGNERFLMESTGDLRIPSVISLTEDMKVKGTFVEFPEELRGEMSGMPDDELKKTITDYRIGKYNHLTEKSLLNIIK